MNILQIVTELDTSDRAEDVIKSTRFLTLNGHKAVVCSRKSGMVRKIDEVGARHYALSLKGDIFLVIADIVKLSQIISKENIHIVHAKDAVSSFVAFFAARFTGSTFVSTIYDYERRNFFSRALVWAKRIICFSESETRRFAKDSSLLQDKVRLIPPFVDVDYPYETRPKNVNLSQYFVIGALLPVFSQEITQNFIRAISILTRSTNKAKVFIMNRDSFPDKDAEDRLKLLIKGNVLTDVVTIVPPGEERPVISTLDLFIQINLDKQIVAKPLLDAASQGIPILTTEADWITDYVENNKTGLVCQPNNPQDMAAKILELYRNKNLRNEIKTAAKNFVKEAFDIKKMMEATICLYEEARSSLNILIIKIGALGDVILSIPSIRAVRMKFPDSKIKVLTAIDKREIFVNSPFINDVIVCDFKERDKGVRGLLAVAKKLRSENFDMVIDLQNNKKSHILSFLSCAPKRYGYDNGKFSFLLNRKIKIAKSLMDPVTHQSRLLGLLGIHAVEKKLELWTSKEDEEWVQAFLGGHWINDNTKLVAINISSSSRWATKLWPTEYFADVSNRLAKELNVRTVLIGSLASDERSEDFLKRSKSKPVSALGKTNILRLASLVKRCSVLVSSDSAPIHIASSVNTPYVALFGPTDPKRHLVPSGESVIFQKGFQCSPCYHTKCKRGHACMRSIKPDEVYEAIVKLLGAR